MDDEPMEMEDSFPSPPRPPPPSPYCSPVAMGRGGGGGPPSYPTSAGTPTGPGLEAAVEARYVSPHSQQISLAEFNKQSHHYTQQALRELKASPEYKQHSMKCGSCGRSWYSGEFSPDCQECDGHAMHRPCPICHGHCGKMWQRNVEMSHSNSQGYWDGTCGHQQAARLIKEMVYMDNITHAMGELKTSET